MPRFQLKADAIIEADSIEEAVDKITDYLNDISIMLEGGEDAGDAPFVSGLFNLIEVGGNAPPREKVAPIFMERFRKNV